MKIKAFTILVILALAFASIAPRTTHAQAYTTSFTTSITYQNVGTAATTSLQILFYATPSTTTPIPITQPNLAAGASSSVFVGSLAIGTSFQGSAVMQADQPLLATLVQVPQNSTTVWVRPLSNGFSDADGAATALIATVIKNTFGVNSKFSIQNVDSQLNNVNIKFYNTSATVVTEINQAIQAGASFYVDAGSLAALGASFNGSVVATAQRADTTAGKIVGSVMEMDITGNGAKAFESVSAGALTLYMPSALCNYGATSQNTSYAIQNASLTVDTSVTVTFSPGGAVLTKPVPHGAKASFAACEAPGISNGYIGSAIITSTVSPVIAVGKVFGGGFSTGFLGAPNGAAKLAMPYVRWAPDTDFQTLKKQRTFIAVQNVGAASIPAGSITVTYADAFGHNANHVYASALAVGAKFSDNASMAGLSYFGMPDTGAGFGGGAIITCTEPGCQLLAIARVETYITADNIATEDYNAMATP